MDLRLASIIVIGILIAIALVLLGDYLGYKIGRPRLAAVCGFTVLGLVVLYAIYAIIVSFVVR
jgi:hypothetical protein